MQTVTDIDQELVRRAGEETGIEDLQELLNAGLERLIRGSRQKRILELRGKIDWQGDLDEWRRD
ncbi:MAG: type II toxin-antitoxin system VapB family antitoxin [Armatimonadia bacterium]|nr:type II toxin-antitoxin system VapB family antitoxin [Armatimonadia bacterium]